MGLSGVMRAEPKIVTFLASRYGANISKACVISCKAMLAIFMSKAEDAPDTRLVAEVIRRRICLFSESVRGDWDNAEVSAAN
jgi:hypothetical protein